MTTREALCHCGQLKVECMGDPIRVSICHCLLCQRRTGSAFGVQARFADEQVKAHGKSQAFTRTGDTGGSVTMNFCPECGSTVYWQLGGLPGFTAVAVGAFADPTFPEPFVAVYEARCHPWVQLPEGQLQERWD